MCCDGKIGVQKAIWCLSLFTVPRAPAEIRISLCQIAHKWSTPGREWGQLSKSRSSSVAEPGWEPGAANDVLALCTGTMMRKGTCGTLTLNGFWIRVWQLLCQTSTEMIVCWLLTWGRGRREGQALPAKAATQPRALPLSALDGSQHPGQALAPSSHPNCPAGLSCEWCWTRSLACSLF